jgi:protein-S-isoprenylcysteine O-methyltransferase Ste14
LRLHPVEAQRRCAQCSVLYRCVHASVGASLSRIYRATYMSSHHGVCQFWSRKVWQFHPQTGVHVKFATKLTCILPPRLGANLEYNINDMVSLIKTIVFLLFSGLILYVSRASLRTPRSHGFYRFFAWEFIAALFSLNVDAWFRDPFSWHQLISWFLLIISLLPLAFGVRSLTVQGKPVERREGEPQLLGFEKTTTLVTTGIYKYIRHPLYSSLLFLTWGISFKMPGWIGLLLAFIATLFLVATAKADEAECLRFFGDSYQEYMKQTRRFVPFLF